MAREFDVPAFYRSPVISRIKEARRIQDPRKKDLRPSVLDFGPVVFKVARHFGFCYGVENAIEIAYRAIEENPMRRVFLVSEMIHNPRVNDDLRGRGIRFLRTTSGEQLIPFTELRSDDVVIVPAFGSTRGVMTELTSRGVDVHTYDTTCPFVEKVWKRSHSIGRDEFTVVIHGKRYHEETRATFSRAAESAPVVVVRDIGEARDLATVITGENDSDFFHHRFADRFSDGFDPNRDLARIGVVNQTTMLASETHEIAEMLRSAIHERFGSDEAKKRFADTSDTLCYATNENQTATLSLLDEPADLAIIVGGYNSSNTSHLVELCEEKLPTFFIKDCTEIDSKELIRHFDVGSRQLREKRNWWPTEEPVTVLLTAGASCPDALLDEVIQLITSWFPEAMAVDTVLEPFAVPESA